MNESHECHANASCTNTEGGYNCSCQLGYSGDGATCTSNILTYVSDGLCFMFHSQTLMNVVVIILHVTKMPPALTLKVVFSAPAVMGSLEMDITVLVSCCCSISVTLLLYVLV